MSPGLCWSLARLAKDPNPVSLDTLWQLEMIFLLIVCCEWLKKYLGYSIKSREEPRYIKVKVEHYLLYMFSPPKISWAVSGIIYICLHLFPVFYLIQPSSKQIICFDFWKQDSVLLIVFYVPWEERPKNVVWTFSTLTYPVCSVLLIRWMVTDRKTRHRFL